MHSGVREHLMGPSLALSGPQERSRLHNYSGHPALMCPSYLLAQKTCYATEEIAGHSLPPRPWRQEPRNAAKGGARCSRPTIS
jgi:hypothetical protein